MVVISLSLMASGSRFTLHQMGGILLEINCLVMRNPARTTGEHHWFLLLPPSYMNTINVWGLEAKGTIRSWRKFSLALHPFQPHPAQWAWHSPPLQGPHLDTIYSKLLHEYSCPQSTTTSGEIAAVCNVSNPMTLPKNLPSGVVCYKIESL